MHMRVVSEKQLELLRKRYPEGTEVCLDHMEGESQMTAGMKGTVFCVDDAGQIHVQWKNGSGLALVPGVDQFHKIGSQEKKKEKEGPSR